MIYVNLFGGCLVSSSVAIIFSVLSSYVIQTVGRQVGFAAWSVDDLTALTFGCEKHDAEKFFPHYIYDKIYLVSECCMLSKCGSLCVLFVPVAFSPQLCFHCKVCHQPSI